MTVFSPVKEKQKAVAASPRKAGSAMRSKLSTGLFTPILDDVKERKSEKKTRSLSSPKMLKKRFKKKSKKEAQKEPYWALGAIRDVCSSPMLIASVR